jgi:hypothetical protein
MEKIQFTKYIYIEINKDDSSTKFPSAIGPLFLIDT